MVPVCLAALSIYFPTTSTQFLIDNWTTCSTIMAESHQ